MGLYIVHEFCILQNIKSNSSFIDILIYLNAFVVTGRVIFNTALILNLAS